MVASWLDTRSIKGIWYQIDPGDADLATFFYYLGQAAAPFSRKSKRSLPLLTPEYLADVEGFARRFFRELFARLPADATLALDNYQEVSSEHWWNSSKVPLGRFEVVAGSGKYAGASGGGTADCKFLKPGPDPQAACNISATIELK